MPLEFQLATGQSIGHCALSILHMREHAVCLFILQLLFCCRCDESSLDLVRAYALIANLIATALSNEDLVGAFA